MCTVTYIPVKDGFVLTSSRDEKVIRPTLKLQPYQHQNGLLVYPKDEIANGTWIAASDQKKIACLLNGGFENHIKKEKYTKSRGTILLESFDFDTHTQFLYNVTLHDIEPFTLLLFDYTKDVEFNQLVWDGKQKHIQKMDAGTTHIWSSATLYSAYDRKLREKWFDNWLMNHSDFEDRNILDFHLAKHSNHETNDIRMKRENDLQTVSISQIRIDNSSATFFYHDLQKETKIEINLNDIKCTQVLQ